MENKIKILILAAGLGTRMKSELPKALAPLHGKPMVEYLVNTATKISSAKPVVVVGYKKELVQAELGDKVEYAVQEEQQGTAHAVLAAEGACEGVDTVVVLSSDQPLIKAETIKNAIAEHLEAGSTITFATTEVPDFEDWRKYFLTHGRILRHEGRVTSIREYNDATKQEREIREVNTGCFYIFDAKWLWENIRKIGNRNAKNEYYLVDLLEIAQISSKVVLTVMIDPAEALGANSKEELAVLENFKI